MAINIKKSHWRKSSNEIFHFITIRHVAAIAVSIAATVIKSAIL